MKNDKKICPFKKTITMRVGRQYSERFAQCAGERCMAYQDGKCLRLSKEVKPDGKR